MLYVTRLTKNTILLLVNIMRLLNFIVLFLNIINISNIVINNYYNILFYFFFLSIIFSYLIFMHYNNMFIIA